MRYECNVVDSATAAAAAGGVANDDDGAAEGDDDDDVPSAARTADGASTTERSKGRRRRRRRRRHVALLFMTIDDLPHEHIWEEWLRSAHRPDDENGANQDEDDHLMVSVLCHAKYPDRIRSPWLRRRHLLRDGGRVDGNWDRRDDVGDDSSSFHTRRPEWGSIDITRAMIDLLEEGLRIGTTGGDGRTSSRDEDDIDAVDRHYRRYLSTPSPVVDGPCDVPPVDRFVFLSESCLPVTTLWECEMALFGPRITDGGEKGGASHDDPRYDKSWMRARSTPNNGYARQLQWEAIRERDVPSRYVWKADQWVALTRAHGEAIVSLSGGRYLDGRSLLSAFRDVRASDEMYLPTALSILGIVRRPSGGGEVEDDVQNDSTAGGGARSMKDGESRAGPGIRRRRVTYCDWTSSARNPASFGPAEWREVAHAARGEGCLFARKFVPGGGRTSSTASGLGRGGDGTVGTNGLISVEAWKSAVANFL